MSKDGRKTHTYRNNYNLWDFFFKNMPNLLPEEIDIQNLWGFFSQIIGKELQKLFSIFKMLQK